jgi:hypothetical protein
MSYGSHCFGTVVNCRSHVELVREQHHDFGQDSSVIIG